HLGFCFPADDSGIDYLQPVIIAGSVHVSFWFDGAPGRETLETQWRALGRQPAQIFPVGFRCLVPVDGRTVSGRIAGVESTRDSGNASPAEPPSRAARPDERGSAAAAIAPPVASRLPGIGSAEKRTARRRKAEMTVEFTSDAVRGTGIIGDISRRGMFVHSNRNPGSGPMVRLKVNLPDGRQLVLTGRVVRSAAASPASGSSGFGLRLLDDWPDYEGLFPRRPK